MAGCLGNEDDTDNDNDSDNDNDNDEEHVRRALVPGLTGMRNGRSKGRLIAASAWSVALHAAVLLIVANVSWVPDEREPSRLMAVVWLEDLRIPDSDVLPDEAEPDAPPDAEPDTPTDAEPDAPPETDPAPAEFEPDATASDSEPTAEAEPEAPPPAPEAPGEPSDEPVPRNYVIREADLEEAWRRAREHVREQREREQNYLTFSLEDVIEPAPLEEPGPTESIFEAAERHGGSGGPSILSPDGARTRLGRRLAELCNALTGGASLMGFGTICADRAEPARLFAHLKPAYLRSRPVCTEVETGGSSEDAAPTIKCRLVVEGLEGLEEFEEFEEFAEE